MVRELPLRKERTFACGAFEVGQDQVAGTAEEDVGWLQVRVSEAGAVDESQAAQQVINALLHRRRRHIVKVRLKIAEAEPAQVVASET